MDIVENIADALGWALFWSGMSSLVGISIMAVIGLFSSKKDKNS